MHICSECFGLCNPEKAALLHGFQKVTATADVYRHSKSSL